MRRRAADEVKGQIATSAMAVLPDPVSAEDDDRALGRRRMAMAPGC